VLAIDHIVFPVTNLAVAAAEFETRYGLASIEGGRHPTWGTANRIIPLGEAYVELVCVVDPSVAAEAAFGTWIATAEPGRPLGWAVRTDAIEAVGRRLGLPIVPGSRAAPGGELITWRSAGVDAATREPGLPFFIQWGAGVPLPGAAPVRHSGGRARLMRLSVNVDPSRLEVWLGEHHLPISASASPNSRMALVLSQGRREYELAAIRDGAGNVETSRDIQRR
jgi:hypothetical protein